MSRILADFVEINLNPYQGLKLEPDVLLMRTSMVEINLNPYQGLKQFLQLLQNWNTKLKST